MSYPWEENPQVQKTQAYVIMSFLALMTLVGAVVGGVTGQWDWFTAGVVILGGLFLCWAVTSLLFIGTVKMLAASDRRKAGRDAQSEHRKSQDKPCSGAPGFRL